MQPKTKLIGFLCLMIMGMHEIKADSTNFSWKTFYGNQFNPGVSIGAGAGHMYHILPSARFKFLRFEIQGSVLDWYLVENQYSTNRSFIISADLFRVFKSHEKSRRYFCFTGAYERHHNREETKLRVSALIGINQYNINKRTSYSYKIGIGHYGWWKYDFRSRVDLAARNYPYAQFSIHYHLFKFQDNQPIISQTELLFYLGKYFNPFISFGLGTDRAVAMPAIGLRSFILHAQVSGYSTDASGITTVEAMINPFLIKSNERFENRLGFGWNQYKWSASDAFSHRRYEINGVLVERTAMRKGKHWSFHAKVGLGIKEDSYSYHDPGANESSSGYKRSIFPMGGLGIQFHLFRLWE